MENMATRVYIACRHGLEQPQGGAYFWWTFSGVGFGMAGERPKHGMGPLAGDPQHPDHFGCLWMTVGLPSKHPRLLGYRMPGTEVRLLLEHIDLQEAQN